MAGQPEYVGVMTTLERAIGSTSHVAQNAELANRHHRNLRIGHRFERCPCAL
jgi:hypothetical protein